MQVACPVPKCQNHPGGVQRLALCTVPAFGTELTRPGSKRWPRPRPLDTLSFLLTAPRPQGSRGQVPVALGTRADAYRVCSGLQAAGQGTPRARASPGHPEECSCALRWAGVWPPWPPPGWDSSFAARLFTAMFTSVRPAAPTSSFFTVFPFFIHLDSPRQLSHLV